MDLQVDRIGFFKPGEALQRAGLVFPQPDVSPWVVPHAEVHAPQKRTDMPVCMGRASADDLEQKLFETQKIGIAGVWTRGKYARIGHRMTSLIQRSVHDPAGQQHG